MTEILTGYELRRLRRLKRETRAKQEPAELIEAAIDRRLQKTESEEPEREKRARIWWSEGAAGKTLR